MIIFKQLILDMGSILVGICRDFLWRLQARKRNYRATLVSLFTHHVLIDVGASYFSPKAWSMAIKSSSSRLVAIDPNGENLNYFKIEDSRRIKIVKKSVGRKSETRILYKTNVDSGSSLYKPRLTDEMKLRSEASLENYLFPCEEREVRTIPLLQAIGKLKESDLIWIKLDTQGSELEILEGAKELLLDPRSIVVELEVSLLSEPIMEGSGKLSDVIEFMEECGLEISKINPIYSSQYTNLINPYTKRGYLNECDVLFTRKLNNFKNWSIERKVGIFLAYLSYGLVDLGFRLANRDTELGEYLSSKHFDLNKTEVLVNHIESIL